MQPDLFAGPARRDESHRLLARLANGGSVPSPARQWRRWGTVQRARLAAVAALLAACAAAWVWRQDEAAPPAAAAHAAAPVLIAPRSFPDTLSLPQAATIVNESARPAPAPAHPPAAAAPHPDGRAVRAPAARAPVAMRLPRSQPAAEGDEDVTLLTAMLRHANGQKPAPTPPKD